MSITYIVFIYLLIWWVLLFAILPFGIERHEETGRGFDAGAPKKANLKKKLIWNTIISAAIMLIIYVLVEIDVIRWRDWFDDGKGVL